MTLLTAISPRIKIGILCTVLMVLAFFVGFLKFTDTIPKHQPRPANIAQADAIVVLTGGKSRIIDALKLLNAGKGSRLLISGVHKLTTRDALRKLAPGQSSRLDCCVDLDKAARNTIGNAAQTAVWALKHKFKSLIVVTSAYHMPRSLIELQHALPAVRFIAYPVLVNSVPVTRWWTNPGTTRLLLSEYVKYLTTLIRFMFN